MSNQPPDSPDSPGVAYAIGTGAGPLIGGAMYTLGPWTLWTLVGTAGLLAALLCLPRRRTYSETQGFVG